MAHVVLAVRSVSGHGGVQALVRVVKPREAIIEIVGSLSVRVGRFGGIVGVIRIPSHRSV